MQCVILAAGVGKRLLPLTKNKPKPLVEINDVPILEQIISRLPETIDELIIVVGYKGNMIREYCGGEFFGRKVTYCTQKNPGAGTGDALLAARDVLRDRFMFLYGDDILGAEGLAELAKETSAISGHYLDSLGRFGSIILREDGMMQEITLGIDNEVNASGLAYVGGAVLDISIFEAVTEESRDSETLLVDMINAFAKDHDVQVVEQKEWIPIGFPEDVQKAELLLNEA